MTSRASRPCCPAAGAFGARLPAPPRACTRAALGDAQGDLAWRCPRSRRSVSVSAKLQMSSRPSARRGVRSVCVCASLGPRARPRCSEAIPCACAMTYAVKALNRLSFSSPHGPPASQIPCEAFCWLPPPRRPDSDVGRLVETSFLALIAYDAARMAVVGFLAIGHAPEAPTGALFRPHPPALARRRLNLHLFFT